MCGTDIEISTLQFANDGDVQSQIGVRGSSGGRSLSLFGLVNFVLLLGVRITTGRVEYSIARACY